MAAHLRPITRECEAPGCTRVATHGLFNTYNALNGSFCKRHADRALKEFQREYEKPEKADA